MNIETTVNVNKHILEMLNNGAAITGKSRNAIIKLLIQRFVKDSQRIIKINSRIRYQERDSKGNWHKIHIVLNEYEYEYYLDFRKLYKMSISFILACAILRYLDKLLKQNISTDKYCYKNYILIKKTVDGIISWQIYWGIPPNLNIL